MMKVVVLVSGVAIAFAVAMGCGSDKDDDKDTSTGTKLTFAADINPIIKSGCSNGDCHGTVSTASVRSTKVYEGAEAALLADKASVKAKFTANLMPPPDKPALSDADKAKILSFLDQ